MVPDYELDVIALIGIKHEQDIEYEEVLLSNSFTLFTSFRVKSYLLVKSHVFTGIIGFD